MRIDYQLSLATSDVFGQGILKLVSEKSGKNQGILLSIVCGNPDDTISMGLSILYFKGSQLEISRI